MAVKEIPEYLKDLEGNKQIVLELVNMYRELKENIGKKLNIVSDVEVNQYISGAKEKSLKHALRGMFVEGKVLSSGNGFNYLVELGGEVELGKKFSEKARSLNKKMQSIAVYDNYIIDLYFDILILYKKYYKEFTVSDLSKFFSTSNKSSDLVMGVLRAQKQAMLDVQENPEKYKYIKNVIDKWDDVYKKKSIDLYNYQELKAAELNSLIPELRMKHKTNSEICQVLSVGERTFMGAKNGNAPIETVENIIEKIKNLNTVPNLDIVPSGETSQTKISAVEKLNEAIADLKEKDSTFNSIEKIAKAIGVGRTTLNEALNAKYSIVAINEKTNKVRSLIRGEQKPKMVSIKPVKEIIIEHGGKTSERGVHFCCLPKDYELIDLNVSDELIKATQKAATTFRACINTLSKLSEDDRDKVRKVLAPEVEEVYHSIQAWAFEFPGRLLEHIDATRNSFNKVEKPGKKGRIYSEKK